MESGNKFLKIITKNRTSWYFYDIMRVININFDIFLEKKSNKNILIYNISYKADMGEKPLLIQIDKIGGFIKIYNAIRCLILLKYNEISDKSKYIISEQSGIIDNINCNLARIRVDSYTSLPIEKYIDFHTVIILIKSVITEEKHNCYNMF